MTHEAKAREIYESIHPDHRPGTALYDAILVALREAEAVPPDVARLVIAARLVAIEDDTSPEAIKELDAASEAFADRVPWDDEPSDEPIAALAKDGGG